MIFEKKRHSNESSLFICLCVLAFGIGGVLFLMSIQERPDDIRKQGVLLDGKVTKMYETVSGRRGNDRGGYFVQAMAMKDGTIVKEHVVFNVGISLYPKFSVGDTVKIWKHKGVFHLDEYGNMEPTDSVWPWQLVLVEAVCLGLIAYMLIRRRKSFKKK